MESENFQHGVLVADLFDSICLKQGNFFWHRQHVSFTLSPFSSYTESLSMVKYVERYATLNKHINYKINKRINKSQTSLCIHRSNTVNTNKRTTCVVDAEFDFQLPNR